MNMVDERKRVVMVASANYSGSTFLDLMLGHGGKCFSCGEVYALFRPFRPHHHNPLCACGNRDCPIWPDALERGERELYGYLLGGGVNVVVDSSKKVEWFRDQLRYHRENPESYVIKRLLLYKHPSNHLYSRYKRGEKLSYSYWTKYYKRLLGIYGGPDVVVAYRDLAQHPRRVLREICGKLGVKYFDGKERFWLNRSHHLFGSDTARLHLYERGTQRHSKLENVLQESRQHVESLDEVDKHRQIYYNTDWKTQLPNKYMTLPLETLNMYNRLEDMKNAG